MPLRNQNDGNDRIGDEDFWEMDEFLPEKKPGRTFSRDTEAVPVSLGGEDAPTVKIPPRPEGTSDRLARAQAALGAAEEKTGVTRRPYVSPVQKNDGEYDEINRRREEMTRALSPAPASEEEYVPENPFLERVRLSPWPVKYVFFEPFLASARKMHPLVGISTPRVPFFSYSPQYQQLSRAQRMFYLWFREEARNGRFIEADFSYVLLYIYEILNLPDLIPPETGVRTLCLLWAHYRRENPRLDRHLSEWVCDYCLIHRVRPPFEIIAPFYSEIVRLAVLKPFWLGENTEVPSPIASAAFGYASNYNYTQSKFLTEQNKELFRTHMRGAFYAAFARLEAKGNLSEGIGICPRSALKGTTVRDAYGGAVIACGLKYKIEVDALMLLRSVEFRFMVTDLEKYIENQIRALLGIKSRFHTRALDPTMKEGVDAYFAPLLSAVREGKKPAQKPTPIPEYEKYYEPLRSDFSPEWAAQIEREAWKTTRLLTEETEEPEEEAEYETTGTNETTGPREESAKTDAPPPGDDGGIAEGFAALLKGDKAAFAAAAARRKLLPDTLAERLNEAALDIVGDIALGDDGGGWSLLTDYKEDIAEWMKSKYRNES